jgi:hypothetical protein
MAKLWQKHTKRFLKKIELPPTLLINITKSTAPARVTLAQKSGMFHI